MNTNKVDLTKASDGQVLNWINGIRKDLIAENPQLLKSTPDDIDEMILDGMVEGYKCGELSKKDLARVFDLMGYVLHDEL